MSCLERASLFTWATGFMSLPPGGFNKLPRQMTILSKKKKTSSSSSELMEMESSEIIANIGDIGHECDFPESRTCFAQVSLPEFKSKEHAKELLLRTVSSFFVSFQLVV